jgi:alanine racemase
MPIPEADGPDSVPGSGSDARAGAILTIDLDAIAANYRLLCDRLGAASCAGVVKADAYGLGAAEVGPALWQAGCRSFFVATLDEGQALRAILPAAEIFILNGLVAAAADDYAQGALLPVLNSLGEVAAWRQAAGRRGAALPAGIQLDSGMSRLGLPPAELDRLLQEPDRLAGIELRLVMSHLACSEDVASPQNPLQLASFRRALARFRPAGAKVSLANSSAIFLGGDYHFDLARPGAALYGLNPQPGRANPLRPVVRLQGRILQLREIDTGTPVGYGATHRFARPARLATIGVGYADGYLRSLSNRGSAIVGGKRVPVVGRVSMDLLTLDVSELPQAVLQPGDLVDLIGPDLPVDAVAEQAGTIGYEILTSLRQRYARRYLPARAG